MVKVMVKTPPPPRTGRPRGTGRCTSTRARARPCCSAGPPADPGFEFRLSCFVFGSGFRASDFGSRASVVGFWLPRWEELDLTSVLEVKRLNPEPRTLTPEAKALLQV